MITSTPSAVSLVGQFWKLMASNDFFSVGSVLADDFILDWPQSNERVRGRERFAILNTQYPASGPWRFLIHRIVGNETEAVSEVSVTDGEQEAKAISFFTIVDGKITRIVEYWPEPYPAPVNRQYLVEEIFPHPQAAA